MHKWEITGINLPTIIIIADSFDDALKISREIDYNYNSGRVID